MIDFNSRILKFSVLILILLIVPAVCAADSNEINEGNEVVIGDDSTSICDVGLDDESASADVDIEQDSTAIGDVEDSINIQFIDEDLNCDQFENSTFEYELYTEVEYSVIESRDEKNTYDMHYSNQEQDSYEINNFSTYKIILQIPDGSDLTLTADQSFNEVNVVDFYNDFDYEDDFCSGKDCQLVLTDKLTDRPGALNKIRTDYAYSINNLVLGDDNFCPATHALSGLNIFGTNFSAHDQELMFGGACFASDFNPTFSYNEIKIFFEGGIFLDF